MTLQDQYLQIKEGKGNKNEFLKQARYLFPEYVNHYNSFNETVKILKGKSILTENLAGLGMVSSDGRKDWFTLFQENVKAVEKNVSKEVIDIQSHAFDNKDMKNIDNLYGQTFLNGFYTEMQDPKNKTKTPDELKQIVAKNLGKDWNYYAKNAQFGIKGIGYTKDTPGLGEPKEPKGKYKASGYGDLPEKTEKVKANTKDTLGEKEAKTTMPKKVEEMPVKPQNSKGVKKMPIPGKPKTIKLQESNSSSKTYSVYELSNGQPNRFYNEEENRFIGGEPKKATLYTKEEAENKAKELLKPRMERYQETGKHYTEIHVGDLYKKGLLRESKLRAIIQQLIKEELDLKEIDEVGKMAEYQAKARKISEEITKRKKKLKALTTLEEIESGSTNPKMVKSLKNEIKKLEKIKEKLDKKFTPKEEVIGEEETTEPIKEAYGMSLKDAKAEAKRISKEEGVVQHVEETEEGSGKYRVSDWYDSDLTVASCENGMEK